MLQNTELSPPKSITFLYTKVETKTQETKKTIVFTIASKKMNKIFRNETEQGR